MNKTFSRSKWYILLLFGMIGQISWCVENMYFNLFVFETISPNLSAVTLMVQLSGVVATLATLFFGTLSDKLGNRRSFISYGYIIWGVSVAVFGIISPELVANIFGTVGEKTIILTLSLVIAADCVMTLFGSTANDAAFNAWVTDNTESSYRGSVEGVLAILPLLAMLIVAGGFGILVSAIGYTALFLSLGAVITVSGVFGVFYIRDNESLTKTGTLRDIIYGFKPKTVKAIPSFYVILLIILIYGIACQIFMPYMIIYMKTYLGLSVVEYSVVFGAAILLGAAVNFYLTRLSDKKSKTVMMYFASALFSIGLFLMYLAKGMGHSLILVLFGIFGFVMITGYIFISALTGSMLRDATPEGEVGKLQGVRMVFSVLIPMLLGPAIGNAINSARNIPLPDIDSADAMTTLYIPAPEIFLAAAIISLLLFALVPVLRRVEKNSSEKQ